MHVAKHDAELTGVAFQGKLPRILADSFGQLGRHILPECVDKLLFSGGFREVADKHVDHEQHQYGEQRILHGQQRPLAGGGVAHDQHRQHGHEGQHGGLDRTQQRQQQGQRDADDDQHQEFLGAHDAGRGKSAVGDVEDHFKDTAGVQYEQSENRQHQHDLQPLPAQGRCQPAAHGGQMECVDDRADWRPGDRVQGAFRGGRPGMVIGRSDRRMSRGQRERQKSSKPPRPSQALHGTGSWTTLLGRMCAREETGLPRKTGSRVLRPMVAHSWHVIC